MINCFCEFEPNNSARNIKIVVETIAPNQLELNDIGNDVKEIYKMISYNQKFIGQ
jgi:hypothetical protein